MTHLPVLPVLLPLLVGASLVLFNDLSLRWQRLISVGATLALLGVALGIGALVETHGHIVYALGSWKPPFGIVLVPDRLSVVMLTLTALLALFANLYACRGDDDRGAHFHALFQFQLMGLNGAFLTGDLFNLFVFFEVLLIASYALLLHGGGPARSRAGLHYVVLNLIGSALFLVGVGTLYGVTGTLNMADLAVHISEAPEADLPLIRAASLILLVVFGVKAALLPLLFWLPRAYTSASAPVAALFAIMTKVGVYSILRVFTVVFGYQTAPEELLAWEWLWPLALATLVLGSIGVLGAKSLRSITAHMVIVSAGTLLATITLGSAGAFSAALFYLIHTTVLTGAFFLFADLIARQRGAIRDYLIDDAAMTHRVGLGILFFFGATALAGLPPFSGFVSKIYILQASLEQNQAALLWPILLGSGLLMIIALSRAGSRFFWRQTDESATAAPLDRVHVGIVTAMLLFSVGMSVQGQPLMDYLMLTGDDLAHPERYIDAVMSADVPVPHHKEGH